MGNGDKNDENIYSEFADTTEKYDSTNIDRSDWYHEFAEFGSLADYAEKQQLPSYENTELRSGVTVIQSKPKGSVLSGIKDFFMDSMTGAYNANIEKARWVSPLDKEKNTIHGRDINYGFYYLFEGNELTNTKDNPATVNVSKDAAPPCQLNQKTSNLKDETLGYWPNYSKLSAKCRGVYLDWLASDRNNKNIPIGYVFVYFSGLEYRIITEKEQVSASEFVSIYKEVIRLFTVYGDNYSFAKYSSNFINYLRALRTGLITAYDLQYPISNKKVREALAPNTEISVAKKIADSEPIDAELAWAWFKRCSSYTFKTPYDRLSNEFKWLFCSIYNKEHPQGIDVRNNGSSLHMVYEPSNFALSKALFPFRNLPNPSTFVIPLRKLTGIAERCNKQLEPMSRYLGKKDVSKNDLEAITLLPPEIFDNASEEEGTIVNSVKKWAKSTIENKNGVGSVKELYLYADQDFFGNESLDSKEKKQFQKTSRLLTELLELAGYGMAPDKRYYNQDIERLEPIVLFEHASPNGFNPSLEFNDAKSVISLAAVIAKTNQAKSDDGTNSQSIDTHSTAAAIVSSVKKHIDLNETELASLNAYALWCLLNSNTSIKLSPKKDHFQVLGNDEATAEIIVCAAFSDTLFNRHRLEKSDKVYGYLGVDRVGLSSLIHRLQTTGQPSITPIQSKGLDFEKLKQYESETIESANILNTVFKEEDSTTFSAPSLPASTFDIEIKQEGSAELVNTTSDDESIVLNGLDSAHSSLYSKLIKKETWSIEVVEGMCQELGLMLSGAIETINDWSFDAINEAVIEEDDEIVIDHDSVEELSQLN